MTQDHKCSACDGIGMIFDESRNHPDCQVCLGAGRISDRMPAKDAVADAETLFNAVSSHVMAWAWQDLVFLSYAPQYAAESIHYGMGDPQDGAELARLAARAAFRAVSGLRGEE